jgi:hypothetical protein
MEDAATIATGHKALVKPKKELTPAESANETRKRVGLHDASKAKAAEATTTAEAKKEAKLALSLQANADVLPSQAVSRAIIMIKQEVLTAAMGQVSSAIVAGRLFDKLNLDREPALTPLRLQALATSGMVNHSRGVHRNMRCVRVSCKSADERHWCCEVDVFLQERWLIIQEEYNKSADERH